MREELRPARCALSPFSPNAVKQACRAGLTSLKKSPAVCLPGVHFLKTSVFMMLAAKEHLPQLVIRAFAPSVLLTLSPFYLKKKSNRLVVPSALNTPMNAGTNTRETTVISLIRMLMDGPEVSLNGSPTVSPTTAAA